MDAELGTVGTAVADATGATDTSTVETTETPVVPGTETATPQPSEAQTTEPLETEISGGESEGELGGEEDLSGGEGAPDAAELKIRNRISELKKTHPEDGKAWAKDHFENAAYKKEFATVHDARNAKTTMDSLGGEEGITKTLGELEEWRNEGQAFAEGKREFLEQLHGENPAALSTAAFNALDVLKENSGTKEGGELFDNAILPHMMERIEVAQVPEAFLRIGNTLNGVLKHIEEGDGQAAYDLLKKVMNPNIDFSFAKMDAWFKHMAQIGKERGEKRTAAAKVDPEREKLDRERQEFEKSKADENEAKLNSATSKLNNVTLDKLTSAFFKDMKIGPEGRSKFKKNLDSEIYASLGKDKTFKRQLANLRAKGDQEAIARHVNAKYAELAPLHFRALRNSLYPGYKPSTTTAKPAANGNGNTPTVPSNGGAVTLEQARQIGVDFDKTSRQEWIAAMNGKNPVWLKNGKQVTIRV